MRVAAPFALDCPCKDAIDEFNLLYKQDSKLEKMFVFFQEHPNKRINVFFENHLPTVTTLIALSAAHKDFHACFDFNPYEKEFFDKLKEQGVKFYFSLPAYNFTSLKRFLSFGVSDVYLAEDLFYHMDTVKKICDDKNVNIRIILNEVITSIPDVYSPIFRPQEFELLDKYFGTGEFTCGSDSLFNPRSYNWNQFNVLYKSWFKKHKWIGQLGEINNSINFDFPCSSFSTNYFGPKMNCGGTCFQGRSCNHCQNLYDMALLLKDKGLIIE